MDRALRTDLDQPHRLPGDAPAGTSRMDVDRRWERAYVDLRPGLLRWLERLLPDQAEAEDCCQESFLRLLREMRDGREPRQPAAWLRRVARNLVVSRARHAQVAARAAHRMRPVDSADTLVAGVVARERWTGVARALAALPADDRDLILRAARGANASDLGSVLGTSAGTARMRLHRARRDLRDASAP